MHKYYVNKNAQNNGDHEVHEETCSFLPHVNNRIYLGVYKDCSQAVKAATKHNRKVNSCYYYCNPCHTT
jgi:hypothetical protein